MAGKEVLLTIITPTYNEADNIEAFVKAVKEVVENDSIPTRMIIVDDSSPDGTGEIVDRLKPKVSSELFELEAIHRPGKQGLGTAYIRGFKEALKTKTKFVLEMDADFSHQPKYIPELVKAAEEADVVIGSRYVKGGGVEGWGLTRKFISFGGSMYAKMILWTPFWDATGGFNLWRRGVLEAIDLDKVKSNGYAFQIEMKYKAFKKGFKIVEVPIVFVDREQGKSKMSGRIFKEAVRRVVELRFEQILRGPQDKWKQI